VNVGYGAGMLNTEFRNSGRVMIDDLDCAAALSL